MYWPGGFEQWSEQGPGAGSFLNHIKHYFINGCGIAPDFELVGPTSVTQSWGESHFLHDSKQCVHQNPKIFRNCEFQKRWYSQSVQKPKNIRNPTRTEIFWPEKPEILWSETRPDSDPNFRIRVFTVFSGFGLKILNHPCPVPAFISFFLGLSGFRKQCCTL